MEQWEEGRKVPIVVAVFVQGSFKLYFKKIKKFSLHSGLLPQEVHPRRLLANCSGSLATLRADPTAQISIIISTAQHPSDLL